MPRQQRLQSKSGYYHIMLRGNERRNIFNDDEDRFRLIDILYEKKQGNKFYLHAFCLMDNHVHLFISKGIEDIALVMKRITVSYVHYFNKKYNRIGHLFQDRFRSEAIEGDGYILSLIKYIHQNPVKANMVKTASEYPWSSYNSYSSENHFSKMLDIDTILGLFSPDKEIAKKLFKNNMNLVSQESFIDIPDNVKIIDEVAAKELFERIILELSIDFDKCPRIELTTMLKRFREESNLSFRKMSIITGLNKDKINKLLKS
ncbi:transposase [Desulfosporosinus fructosivorans]|uniref:Transposase n=1 Tax=Desulfosporosinus fructosivorans TaxID=2018669 RepID=A0A4Z0R6T0_9FIRM|nr:transposase [Desulfosporosinus fructosivorans]TGE38075.1 transposase [Desulfosporosinus fructosivorans]